MFFNIKLQCVSSVTVTNNICIIVGGTNRHHIFVLEPINVTVIEGESTKMNCSTGVINEDIAIWEIGGLEFYWTEFADIEVFSFDLRDNSLTINNSPHSLDGTSFRCILGNYESQLGYLTVLHLSTTASTTNSTSQIGE